MLKQQASSRIAAHGVAQLPAVPLTLDDTGLDQLFLSALICKILFLRGKMNLADMSAHIKLPVGVLTGLFDQLRADYLCELTSRGDNSAGTIYQLTDAGRLRAVDYLRRSHYAGPAPVSLDVYSAQVEQQSIRAMRHTRESIAAGFKGIVIHDGILDQLGAALNSGRAIILHGQPGCGKTYIAERLSALMLDDILIPYAIVVDGEVIQIYDPHVHQALPASVSPVIGFERKQLVDTRWLMCKRPLTMTGGELTLAALDLEFDNGTRYYQAPQHVKANNGVFIIDDLGRQLVAPQDLMNRWIMPLDRRTDCLTLHTGYRFRIPFDVIVVFSSNQDPAGLADEAFLRRLGYKIFLDALSEDQYRQVFCKVCEQLSIPFSEAALQHLLREHHDREERPLLACYPRDLLEQVRDLAQYEGRPPALTAETLDWAWQNYFTSRQRMRGMGLSAVPRPVSEGGSAQSSHAILSRL